MVIDSSRALLVYELAPEIIVVADLGPSVSAYNHVFLDLALN